MLWNGDWIILRLPENQTVIRWGKFDTKSGGGKITLFDSDIILAT